MTTVIPSTGQKPNYLHGRAQTKHAREFKEAWYSIDNNTINTIYLQFKTIRNNPTNKNSAMTNDINFPITLLSAPATQQSNDSNGVISIDQTHSLPRQRILQPPNR